MRRFFACLTALCVLAASCAFAVAEDADIVVLFTNDVHCGIDDAIGYAGLAAYKQAMITAGHPVALVDAGDAIQGAAVGTLSAGGDIVPIMDAVGYDLAVPGNHEFDYGMPRFLELASAAKATYISCNFTDLKTGKPVFDAYKILPLGGAKVAFVGICTPRTITSSTPAYFQDENGAFIYGFHQGADGSALYACVQEAVNAARANGADYVIAVAHLGILENCSPWMSTEVITNTTGIDAVIDGHSHSIIEGELVKNKDGKNVLLTSTGTKLNAIGKLTISSDGKFSASLITEYAPKDDAIIALIEETKAKFANVLNVVVAKTDVDLIINDPKTGVRVIRRAETNLGDLCADAYRSVAASEIAIVNGGGIRATIKAGDITYGDLIAVQPYNNMLCVIEATGREILDALELGVRSMPEESGSFLHVSGITFEVHTDVPSSVKLDENGMFVSVDGEYRVKNVLVGGEPLDLDRLYTLSSHNYLLKDGSFTMLTDNTLLTDEMMLDNQVLITYITETLGGVVGEQYAEPFGDGRIIAIAE